MNFPNLFVNAGFEHGDIVGWFSSSNASSASSAEHKSGKYCAAGGGWADLQQKVHCWNNTSYIVSCWVKAVKSGISAQFKIQAGDQAGNGSTFATSPPYAVTNGWTQMTYTFNSGVHTQITVDFTLTAYNGGGVALYMDDFQIYPAATAGIDWSPSSNPWPLCFSDDFNDASHIDSNASNADGFLWYPQMFYGYGTNAPSHWSVENGALIIKDSNCNWSDTLHTARPGPDGYLGTVFNGGSGAYFECRCRFMNYSAISTSGWPSFWLDSQAMGYQTLSNTEEAMELDILEFFPSVWSNNNTTYTAFTVHNWIKGMADGQAGVGANSWMPVGTDPFKDYHNYGMLWIPASSENNQIGYVQAFFDGVPGPAWVWKGNQTYSGPTPPTPESLMANGYLLSQVDNQWQMLIVGSAQGGTPTFDIDYVKVWAADPAKTLKVVTTGGGSTPPPDPSFPSYSQWLDQLADWIKTHPAIPNG